MTSPESAPLSFPEMYERFLVERLFQPFAESLLDRLEPPKGSRLLDVACGTGIVARTARRRLGPDAMIVGIDVSPGMLDVARRTAPDIDWRVGDATQLPLLAGEAFDSVVCHQGLQFMPDKPAAIREMHKALVRGGRVAVATWRPHRDIPMFGELHAVAEKHLGPIVDHRHGFGEAEPLRALLEDAAFRDIQVATESRTTRFEDGSVFIRLNTMALVGMSSRAKGMADEEKARVAEAIVADCAPVAARYATGTAIEFRNATNLAIGRK
jgi:ubiquinone/menaquinone biosynthesis C-methylase UbiE